MDRYYWARITRWGLPNQAHLWTFSANLMLQKHSYCYCATENSYCFLLCVLHAHFPSLPSLAQLSSSPSALESTFRWPFLPPSPQAARCCSPEASCHHNHVYIPHCFCLSSSKGAKTYPNWCLQHSAWHRIIDHFKSKVGWKGIGGLPLMILSASVDNTA